MKTKLQSDSTIMPRSSAAVGCAVATFDYIGFELDKGNIDVGIAGNMLGTCMRGGKIVAKKAGDETGSSMTGGEIIADESKSIGNTIGGRINTEKAGKLSRYQGAEIFIRGVKFKRSLLDRLLGK